VFTADLYAYYKEDKMWVRTNPTTGRTDALKLKGWKDIFPTPQEEETE